MCLKMCLQDLNNSAIYIQAYFYFSALLLLLYEQTLLQNCNEKQ